MMKVALALTLALTLTSLTACGDDGGDPVDASNAQADAASTIDSGAPVAGTLTVTSPSLSGLTGKVLVVFVLDGAARVGGACEMVTTDPQTITTVAKAPNSPMGNPCDLGGDATLQPKTYDVTAGIYTPGMMTPESCSSTTATIAGDTEITLPAFGACP